MEVLHGPWADLALVLRQTITHSDADTHSFVLLWLCALVLFLSVSVLLLQMIVYFQWKLRQVTHEAALSGFVQDRSAPYRKLSGSAHVRKNVGSHSYT